MLLLDATNYNASDSEESLLPSERGSFADKEEALQIPEQQPAGLQVSELMKQKAKEQALKGLGRPIDKKLSEVGQRAGLSPESLARLGEDTPENRELLKEEAKERAKQFSKRTGQQLERKLASRGGAQLGEAAADLGKGARMAQEARTAATVAKGAKTAATAAKGAKAAGTAVKGVQGVVAVAGVAAGPETLGLGTLAAFLLNIAISIGISDAIDMAFELKAGNFQKAKFHAIKAVYLIVMFIMLLVLGILSLTVVGIIVAAIPLLLMNVYAVLGLFFPENPFLQGLSRKWMMALLILLDIFVIIVVLTFLMAVLYGICTLPVIGSLIGWTGIIGDAINYVDSNFGTGGYLSALNQACASITKF